MAELVDALDLGSSALWHEGSIPSLVTNYSHSLMDKTSDYGSDDMGSTPIENTKKFL